MKKLFMILMTGMLIFSCTSVHYNCNSSKKNLKCNTKVDIGVPDIEVEIK